MITAYFEGNLRFQWTYQKPGDYKQSTIILPAVAGKGYLIQQIETNDDADITVVVKVGAVTLATYFNDVSVQGYVMTINYPGLGWQFPLNTAVTIQATVASGTITSFRASGNMWQ